MAWVRPNRPPTGPLDTVPGPLDRLVAATERLTSTYAGPDWFEEMARARQEFEQRRGKVYQDEPMFEAQLSAFLEWYVLDRPLGDGQTPVLRALEASSARGEVDEALRALARSFRGLFEVVEVLRRETLLRDLLRGGLWRVRQDPPLPGIDADDIFEARLLPWSSPSGSGEVRFGPLFCFHPRAARPSILQLLETLEARGPLGPEVLNILAVMRLNHERFRNITIDRIYSLSWRGGGDARRRGAPVARQATATSTTPEAEDEQRSPESGEGEGR